jgi:hypothetical protein
MNREDFRRFQKKTDKDTRFQMKTEENRITQIKTYEYRRQIKTEYFR